ncbi:GNAT family N-acetyltransferase [Candidatus Protochlamydia naegleriophila]|nr:GNAT family N-acetyltransferase [Candidatus Protochlamydia naegleriophila]
MTYLFVEESYRGQGIARRLMNHAVEPEKNEDVNLLLWKR